MQRACTSTSSKKVSSSLDDYMMYLHSFDLIKVDSSVISMSSGLQA